MFIFTFLDIFSNSHEMASLSSDSARQKRTSELLQRMGMNPTTSTSTKDRTEEPYYARLYNDHARKQESFKAREAKIAAEESLHAPTFQPHINSDKEVERILPGEGDLSQRLETWRTRRNQRRIEAQNKIIQEQEALMRETPAINAYSHELADELIADGKRHPDVAEHLYSLAPEFDKKVEWMKAQQMAAEVPTTPMITKMAKDLEREGPVGDRLYESALETRAKLNKQRADAAAVTIFKQNRGGATPETKAKQRSHVIGHSLYDRAVKQRQDKETMRKKKQKDIAEKRNQRHITRTVRYFLMLLKLFSLFLKEKRML